jgi:phosphate:Na+ symporter
MATKMAKRGVIFSDSGRDELQRIVDRLIANVRAAASLFMTGDERAARQLAAEKEAFRALEADATDAHFERLRLGRVNSAETSALHLDALRDLKAVNTHIVAAAAYPVLASRGELLATRIRSDG